MNFDPIKILSYLPNQNIIVYCLKIILYFSAGCVYHAGGFMDLVYVLIAFHPGRYHADENKSYHCCYTKSFGFTIVLRAKGNKDKNQDSDENIHSNFTISWRIFQKRTIPEFILFVFVRYNGINTPYCFCILFLCNEILQLFGSFVRIEA